MHVIFASRERHRARGMTLAFMMAVLAALCAPARVRAAAVTAGYRDFSYGSLPNAPTADKPQHKLWYQDGAWWGILYNTSLSAYSIYRFDQSNQDWLATGTEVDSRANVGMDTLWDGASLYVVSGGDSEPARLTRFHYDPALGHYSLAAGFPVTVRDAGAETISLAKDSTGKLWATWEADGRIYVNRSLGSDLLWGQPFILPVAGTNVSTDDISAVIAFRNDSIGVMWSNQVARRFYFAVHRDTDPDGTWQASEIALPGPGQNAAWAWADDHINLKTAGSGADQRVYAAVKTGLDDVAAAGPQAPLTMLLERLPNGVWNSYPFGRVQDKHTRPIVAIDDEHGVAYMMASAPVSGGTIYIKSAPLSQIAFPVGLGDRAIYSSQDKRVNNVTTTRQPLFGATGLLALASDDSTGRYLHAWLDLGSSVSSPAPPASLTADPLSTTSIRLAWEDRSSSEDGFQIDISGDGVSFAPLTNVGPNTTSFVSDGLAPATTYAYRVRAFNGAGQSIYSNVASGTTYSNLVTPPPAPIGLTATGTSGSEIGLAWIDPSGDETAFEVERKTGVDPFAQIAILPANTTSFADVALVPGITFTYRVRATNAGGPSAYTNEASAATRPEAPSVTMPAVADTYVNDGATAGTNFGAATTLLVKSANGAGYNRDAYFKFNLPADFQPTSALLRVFGTLSAAGDHSAEVYAVPDTSWNEATMTWNNRPALGPALATVTLNGTANLWYEADVSDYVLAEQAAGRQTVSLAMHSLITSSSTVIRLFSRERGAGAPELVLLSSPAPDAPSQLEANAVSSNQVNLEWSDNADTELGFEVERSTNGSDFSRIRTLDPDTTGFSDTGLLPATTYHYRVRAVGSGNHSAYTNVATATTLTTPPAAPTDLTAIALSASAIRLAWTDLATNEDAYAIERSPDGAAFVEIATVPANTAEYDVLGLNEMTTWYYRVRAQNAAGDSGYSNTASATTLAAPHNPPAAPASLAATAASADTINLAWTDTATDEDAFRVERSLNGADFSTVAILGEGATTHSDTGLDPATTYHYRVIATNAAGDSIPSNVASTTTLGLPPSAPFALHAVAVGPDRVDLTWVENATDETAIVVERSRDGSLFQQVASLSANTTSWSDTSDLTGSTTYYYRVFTANANGTSSASNVASATTPADSAPTPSAPGGLVATVGPYDWWRVELDWTDNSSSEKGFIVQRSTDGSTFTTRAALPANTTTYTDTGLTQDTTYSYRVVAYSDNGNSAASNTATATTKKKAPDEPTNFTVTPVSGTQIDLMWTDVAVNEEGYEVHAAPNGTKWAIIAVLPPNAQGFSHTGLTPNSSWSYRLRVFNNGGWKWTSIHAAKTLP